MLASTSSGGRLARAAGRELLVFLLFLLLSIAMTWPLVRHMDRALPDPGDPYLNAWILDWVQYATLHGKPIWDAPIFHPSRLAITFSENMLLVAWILIPARLLGSDPVTIYNLATVLGFALTGYGGYVMVRAALGSFLPALAGGIFFAFVPYRFDQLPHLQHIWAGFLALLFAAAIHYVRRPGWRSAILLGAAFAANGLTNLHWFAFGSVALAAVLLVGAIVDRRWRDIHFWVRAGVALAVAVALLLPMLNAYSEAKRIHDLRRNRAEVRFFSATIEDWLVPPGRTSLYEKMPARPFRLPERTLFPGFLVILLSVAGVIAIRRSELPDLPERDAESPGPRPLRPALARSIDVVIAALFVAIAARAEVTPIGESNRLNFDFESRLTLVAFALLAFRIVTLRSWAPLRWARGRYPAGVWMAIALIPIGVLGSLGLNSWFHTFLYDVFSQFRGIRAPARWGVIAYAGLAITAALAVHAMRRWPRRQATAAGIAVVVLFLFELHPGHIRWYLVQPEKPPVYRWLKTAPFRGAVVELPMADPGMEMAHLFMATEHHRPLVNGFSGYDPLPRRELAAWSASNPIDPAFLGKLEAIRTSLVVVHADQLELKPDEPLRVWLREGIRSGRLTFVKHFDADIQGTFVFALTRVEPLAAAWRDAEVADASGRTPIENLRTFLAGTDFVMTRRPAGYVLVEQNTGTEALKISGWAASLAGIRSVELLFEGETVRYEADLGTRLDVERRMPWYAGGKAVHFEKRFEKWPRAVHLETDVIVRITDKEGRVRHLEQRWLDRQRPDL
ncbi:MAG TPA: hypothetical protein VFV54_10515 [Thermoanaerobaculia bacterium]|nr:hypothetical protein [Thermoanaerobaculia bacterium]